MADQELTEVELRLQKEIIAVEQSEEAKEAKQQQLPSGSKRFSPRRKGKAGQYELITRRKKVQRYYLRGFTYEQIAKELGISEATVDKDRAAIKKVNLARVDQFQQSQFVGETMLIYDEVTEHAWEEFESADPGSKQRLQALDLIRTTQNDKLRALTDVGLVSKAVQEVQHTHMIQLPWDEKIKDTIARQLIESQLTPQFALPTPDPDHVPGRNPDPPVIIDAVITTPAPVESK